MANLTGRNVATCLALLLCANANAGSLLVNGSFESTLFTPSGADNLFPGDSGLVGWEIFGGSVQLITELLWDTTDGLNSIDLDGITGDVGGIRQTIATTPGQTYNVSFDLAGNPATFTPLIKEMMVSADGQSAAFQFDISNTDTVNMGWVPIMWSFVADDNSADLQFQSLSDPSTAGWGAALDNVSVTAAVVPLPGALVLFLPALLTLCPKRSSKSTV